MNAAKVITRIVLGLVLGLAALFALFYLLTWGDYPVPETVADDPSLPHITIDGVTYHAETFGDPSNPVVITIHGGPGGDYRSILSLKALSDDYFVVFFDQRGAGLSPRVDPDEITLGFSSRRSRFYHRSLWWRRASQPCYALVGSNVGFGLFGTTSRQS